MCERGFGVISGRRSFCKKNQKTFIPEWDKNLLLLFYRKEELPRFEREMCLLALDSDQLDDCCAGWCFVSLSGD
jgi:hypothetical protein